MSIPHHPLLCGSGHSSFRVSPRCLRDVRGCLRRGSYLWRSRNRDHLRHCDLSHQADGTGTKGRRTWHQYYARGGFVRSALPQTNRYVRPPSPPLTDWNLIPVSPNTLTRPCGFSFRTGILRNASGLRGAMILCSEQKCLGRGDAVANPAQRVRTLVADF